MWLFAFDRYVESKAQWVEIYEKKSKHSSAQ